MQSIVSVGENGYRFALHFLDEEGSVGFLRVRFEFGPPWCAGGFEFLSSKERIDLFVKEIGKEVVYLSDEGNLEIKCKPKSNGLLEISVLGIPNMAKDDRIEFEIEGLIRVTSGQNM
jgi:hypothetical protein